MNTAITEIERKALYKVIYSRRDVRGQFLSDPVPDDVLGRLLDAAHHAPSVGFMQPWDFIVVKEPEVRQKVKSGFEIAHAEAAAMFSGKKQEAYCSLKLEGIMESPLGICVTCDRSRSGDVVIGRTANPEMDLYSSVCAVQNLWLAARAENLGVGWVSIIHHDHIRQALGIPEHIVPVAWLCVGYVSFFHKTPELQQAGWLPRMELDSLVHYETW
ncbi:5,6-dimethylbenzimidazole synthase [Chlorobium phaeobacteroides]|jgi:5,6-dimethylbenzimidazole synthase|uniref:5,6-dimethylbenzimidazole synthase n=1 Tax=Chlorobium phaeobacteroides (strain DSM 266 / SMG 266 / 2430) TaxID=290317 RepID=A1BFH9_CHLPD|nr:5,6-dimethylbenzimidazole synthase [Chlorobium phaeobacteroides]ABL65156.1 cob(II)yrinic acid a,c-diamide reductase [Chlorobium phaeobacteroides DSM 266]MBV5326845.1 5,6-dimethylbenzimidazole synthase [Chlorobium sp.]